MTVETESSNVDDSNHEAEPAQLLDDEANKNLPVKKTTSSCTGLKVFLAALSFSYLSKTLSGTIMKSSITQIERRFDLTSSTVGFIDGNFEMGNLLVIAFVSYFGAKLHRPKVIAVGCFTMALGSLLTAMPHFFMGYYKYETASHTASSANLTSSTNPCSLHQDVNETLEVSRSGCEKEPSSYMWIYILLGNLLRGIGETPITPLGISYLDDFAKEEDVPVYVACLHTIAMLGPMFGFLLGSLCAKLYVDIGFVDLGSITITPQDSRWVGAWWLGFLIGGATSFLAAIPFFFLPKSLKKPEEANNDKTSYDLLENMGATRKTIPPAKPKPRKWSVILKGFSSCISTSGVFQEPDFAFRYSHANEDQYDLPLDSREKDFALSFIDYSPFSSFIGFLTYKPKYMEQQYGQSTSKSNFLIGLTSLPPVGIGLFLGGLIMKKYKMSIIGATKFAFTMSFLAYVTTLLHFFVGCENHVVAGITVSYEGKPIPYHENAVFSECNSDCKCASDVWDPVCGDNGLTYISACLAGCTTSVGHGRNTAFHNCSCLEASSSWTGNNSATLGQCPKSEDCSMKFIYYTVIQVISGFCYALGGTPAYMIMFRCVQPELKSLAVGLYTLIMRMLAGIPAPVYFGALIDKTCLKWGSTSCGQRGACRLYDSNAYRYVYLGLSAVLRGPSYLIAIFFYILVKKHFQNKNARPTENGGREDVPMNKEDNCKINERLPGSSDAENESCI